MPSSSQDQTKKSKKRKSMASGEAPAAAIAGEVSVDVAESSGAGPAFVNFPSVKPNKKVPFTIYSRDPAASTSDLSKQQSLIAGETEDVEYFSTNRDKQALGEGGECQYIAGLYDPATKTLHVQQAPLYLVAHRVKRLREAPLLPSPAAAAALQWKTKRNDLGETFGTRKAKSQIKAEERNKVDVNAMQGVRADLIQSIVGQSAAASGPEAPPDLIPTPDLSTSDPSKVYVRANIVPDNEWSSINVSNLITAEDDRKRSAALPFRNSRWIEDKMRVAVEGPKAQRKDSLRMLYYLSTLLAMYKAAGALSKLSRAELPGKFQGVPSQVLDGLLTRFADKSGKGFTVTDKGKTKLMMWICTCYLAADNWSVDIGRVAKDLGLPSTKISDMYKSLGCKVDLLPPAEREALGLSMSEARERRRATLKAPVVYPKIKRRGPAKH